MEEGKYYGIRYSQTNIVYYIKCGCVKFDTLSAYYSIRVSDKTYHTNYLFGIKNHIFEEVLLSDFVEYLPSDNPDKILFLRKKRLQLLLNYENI